MDTAFGRLREDNDIDDNVYGDSTTENFKDGVVTTNYTGRDRGVPGFKTNICKDYNNGNIAQKIGDGQIIMSPCDIIHETMVAAPRRCTRQVHYVNRGDGSPDGFGSEWTNIINGGASPAVPSGRLVSDSQLLAAGSRTLAKAHANATSSSALALVTLAELRKTIASWTDLGKKLYKAGQFLKRNRFFLKSLGGSFRLAKHLTIPDQRKIKRLGSEWLGYRYGLRQAYFDFRSYAEALESIGKSTRQRVTSSETLNDSELIQDLQPWKGDLYREYNLKRLCSCNIESGVLFEPRLDTVSPFHAYGYGQILTTAWELTKYSWIVDWFWDIGTRIQAYSPSVQGEVVGCWTTYEIMEFNNHYVDVKQGEVIGDSNYPEGSYEFTGASGAWPATRTWTRKRKLRFPQPKLTPLPSLRIRVDGGKVADILALLTKVRD